MSTQQLKQKGFTIIEVVLVLAIAALIFLMVFIALPALQRNQRDTARKTVLSKVSASVTTYQSNKRGNQPSKGVDLNGYIDGQDADGTESYASNTTTKAVKGVDSIAENNYIVKVSAGAVGVGVADTNAIQVYTGAKCNDTGDAAVTTGASTRNAAILIKLENGDAFVCQTV